MKLNKVAQPPAVGAFPDKGVKASLAFIVCNAFRHIFPGKALVSQHSFSDGYFLAESEQRPISHAEVTLLASTVQEWLTRCQLEYTTASREILLSTLCKSRLDLRKVLQVWRAHHLPVIRLSLENPEVDSSIIVFTDLCYRAEVETDTQRLASLYDLVPLHGGILLRFLSETGDKSPLVLGHRSPMFSILSDYQHLNHTLGVKYIYQLNDKVVDKSVTQLIWIAEGLHEKRLSAIADHATGGLRAAASSHLRKRIMCMAGPSSSGKTTSANRLMVHLKMNGYPSVLFSMDDYYKNSSDVPITPAGDKDYESLESIDTDLLATRVADLLAGKPVQKRVYSFRRHEGQDVDGPAGEVRVTDETFIIIEGLHALNPAFTAVLGGSGKVHRIYVSALPQLQIDMHHHVSSSDVRLLRRMLRDYRTRGYSCEETLRRWPAVRTGEDKYLFPYQEEADFIFNSSLMYELCILSNYCKPLLLEVSGKPSLVAEADRLLTFCNLFYTITEEMIPRHSILREFLGGSAFDV